MLFFALLRIPSTQTIFEGLEVRSLLWKHKNTLFVHSEILLMSIPVIDVAGDWQMGPKVSPLDPTTVKSVVEFGTRSGRYTQSATGTSEVYSQIYPFEGLLNYTSGIIHHVRITGNFSLSPFTGLV